MYPAAEPNAMISELQPILERVFGFRSLRPGQAEIIGAILQGQHVLGVMPTGAGKSLCYQLPALAGAGLTLVISPLVALMNDQVAALRLSGVAAEAINSNRLYADNAASWRRVAAGQTRLLYMAPERLMQPRMIQALQNLPLALIAVDEAHCISRWGPSFRPDYEALAQLGTLFPQVPIAAFTATADRATRQDICTKLFNRPGKMFCLGFDRPNIHLAVQERNNGRRQLLHFVQARQRQNGIVYCLSRQGTENTATLLKTQGISALPYHAGLDPGTRLEHQQIFMTHSDVVMVATIAFGMGIDKPDIRYVFHTNLPANIEAYYQEIGRAGRDGLPAETLMVYGLDDITQRRRFIDEADSDAEYRRREHQRLDLLLGYCEGVQCRRQALLGAFDETLAEPCGNCDNCQNPPELVEGLAEGQKVLSAAYRTGQWFGASHLTDILTGKSTAKVLERGHDRLPTFGVGQDRSAREWRSIIRQLVAGGFLMSDIGAYGSLKITPRGRQLLAGHETFFFRRNQARPVSRSKIRTPASSAPEVPVLDSEEAQALFDHLRKVRLALARERGVPAFVILWDRSLVEMAQYRPRTEADLRAIHGVGEAKIRDLGAIFLEAIVLFETSGREGRDRDIPDRQQPRSSML